MCALREKLRDRRKKSKGTAYLESSVPPAASASEAVGSQVALISGGGGSLEAAAKHDAVLSPAGKAEAADLMKAETYEPPIAAADSGEKRS